MAYIDGLRLNSNSNPATARGANITKVMVSQTRDRSGLIILVSFQGRTGLVINETKVITTTGTAVADLRQVVKFLEDQGWRKRGQATRSQQELTCAAEEATSPDVP